MLSYLGPYLWVVNGHWTSLIGNVWPNSSQSIGGNTKYGKRWPTQTVYKLVPKPHFNTFWYNDVTWKQIMLVMGLHASQVCLCVALCSRAVFCSCGSTLARSAQRKGCSRGRGAASMWCHFQCDRLEQNFINARTLLSNIAPGDCSTKLWGTCLKV